MMKKDSDIDFDCEFYVQRVVGEGELDDNRRTTQSVIYHLCLYHGQESKKERCSIKRCPKKNKKK